MHPPRPRPAPPAPPAPRTPQHSNAISGPQMTIARYERIKDTFFACMRFPRPSRRRLYQLLCGDDPTLVEDLLNYERGSANPFYMVALLLNWFGQIKASHNAPAIEDRIKNGVCGNRAAIGSTHRCNPTCN
jgi:hypothetical protein